MEYPYYYGAILITLDLSLVGGYNRQNVPIWQNLSFQFTMLGMEVEIRAKWRFVRKLSIVLLSTLTDLRAHENTDLHTGIYISQEGFVREIFSSES